VAVLAVRREDGIRVSPTPQRKFLLDVATLG